jgi:hypothetical protein
MKKLDGGGREGKGRGGVSYNMDGQKVNYFLTAAQNPKVKKKKKEKKGLESGWAVWQ